MLKFILLSLTLISSVSAESILLGEYDNTIEGRYDHEAAYINDKGVHFFLAKKQMGWLPATHRRESQWGVVKYDKLLAESFTLPEIQTLPVANSKHDTKIVYQAPGLEEVICFNIVKARFSYSFYVNETGNCEAELRKSYEIGNPKIQVWLHIKR